MANKRQLKKEIQYKCGDTAAEIIEAMYMDDLDRGQVNLIINDIADLQVQSLAHTNFAFDKTPRDFDNRAAYNKALSEYNRRAFDRLRKDFNEGLQKIVDKMNALLTPEVKAANKAAVNG